MTESDAAPGGTVTFLFSDIERSTQLEQALGTERYGQVLERHRALLRAAWQANGGIEQGTEGDSFFVTFGRATSALAAAIAGQRALHGEAWPDGADVRVRMGLHTGESERVGAASRRRRDGRHRHQPGGTRRRGRPWRPDPHVRRDERVAGDAPATRRHAA